MSYSQSWFVLWIDESLSLDCLVIQVGSQIIPKWYQFGLAVGIARETLDEFSSYPPEECAVKILDYWFKNSFNKPTWKDVAKALNDVDLHQVAVELDKLYLSKDNTEFYPPPLPLRSQSIS